MADFEPAKDTAEYPMYYDKDDYVNWSESEAELDELYHFEEEPDLNFAGHHNFHEEFSDLEDGEEGDKEAHAIENLINYLGPELALSFQCACAGMTRPAILVHLNASGFPMCLATLSQRLQTLKLSTTHPPLTSKQHNCADPIIFQCHQLGYSHSETIHELQAFNTPMTNWRLRDISKEMGLNWKLDDLQSGKISQADLVELAQFLVAGQDASAGY
ncbi:hypothetical protein CROQUDRAFT_98697 [Cronartium quercuum f. sp. fusiforme G11]|uniref:Uncharacterized protein n=1 Tax=Cronartium quercuum f. sp. fusiforme G11 TaxID=708437 RepID=A0A9P6T7E2_9BASI|nr:hypothetical protein CROQUDRAFT_98697 [Cronartium quercuum f. sp. fusiforme G11]